MTDLSEPIILKEGETFTVTTTCPGCGLEAVYTNTRTAEVQTVGCKCGYALTKVEKVVIVVGDLEILRRQLSVLVEKPHGSV